MATDGPTNVDCETLLYSRARSIERERNDVEQRAAQQRTNRVQ